MNHEIATEWVSALRSGKYRQGYGQLYDGKSYCCLGVLCEIIGKKFIQKEIDTYVIMTGTKLVDKNKTAYCVEGTEEHLVLPRVICKEAGLRSPTAVVRNMDDIELSVLNDDGKSFKEIATVIEQNWRSL